MAAKQLRTFKVQPDLWADAKAEAEARGETVTDAITRALIRYTASQRKTTNGKDNRA